MACSENAGLPPVPGDLEEFRRPVPYLFGERPGRGERHEAAKSRGRQEADI